MDELLKERYALSMERVCQIREEEEVAEPFRSFFLHEAKYLVFMDEYRRAVEAKQFECMTLEQMQDYNRRMYAEIYRNIMVTVTGILLMQSSGLGRSMDRFSAFFMRNCGA